MNKIIIAVYDTEPEFASRFVGYLKDKYEDMYDMYAFTEFGALEKFAFMHPPDVLVISDKSREELSDDFKLKSLGAKEIVVLSENPRNRCEDYKMVEKYRPADVVFHEVMEYAAKKENGNFTVGVSTKKVIGIYSPAGRCMKTTFALTLCRIMADFEKVLYINYEEYSGFKELLGETYAGDLSDFMYYFMQDGCDLRNRLSGICRKTDKFDYIPPMLYSADIRNISMDIWTSMIRNILELNIYNTVVLDITNMLQNVLDMLRICNRIYVPATADDISCAKVCEFEQNLINRHENEILGRIKKFVINPEDYCMGGGYDFNKTLNSGFEDFVRNIYFETEA